MATTPAVRAVRRPVVDCPRELGEPVIDFLPCGLALRTRWWPPRPGSRNGRFILVKRSRGDLVLTLHETTGVLTRDDMPEMNVGFQRTKQRDTRPDQDWHARDDQALNEARTQETLNRDPAVDICVCDAARRKLPGDVSRVS